MEENRGEPKNPKFVIPIPSYEEVVGNAPAKAAQQSLFAPSPSFSQAFNSMKKSEFYETPPRPREVSPPPPASGDSVEAAAPSTSVPAARGSRNSIIVSNRQKGNPLLKYIRNVRWAFDDIVCDYMLGQNTCALYLSLRYHLLHPDYLYFRIRELQKNFKLRVVLCHIDVEDVFKPLHEVTKTALLHDCTLLCGWSLEECARYLETIKVYENKPADLIQGQTDMDYLSRLNHALTAVRHVNKTDVVTLGSTFGSLAHIMDASMEDLARCPGIGERKVKRLYDTFHEPFKRAAPINGKASNDPVGRVDETEGSKEKQESFDDSRKRKKEAEVSVRSALEAAFAKYSGRSMGGALQDEQKSATNDQTNLD